MVVDETTERRRRLSAEDRRIAILEAAREVFSRRGFHGGLTSEIATVAGCSEPMLYKHFPSKQALFAAVLEAAGEEMCQRVEALTAQGDDPLRSLADVFHTLREEPRVLEIMRLRMLAVTLVDDNPDIRAALETTANRMRKRVTKAVADQQAAGAVRDDVDAEQVAWLYFGIVISAGFRYAVYGDRTHKSFTQLPETLLQLLKTPTKEVSS